MSAFLSLPPVYRVAVLLGARVEVYIKRQDEWCPYHQCIFSYDTPLRLKEGDEVLLEQAHKMVPQFYDTVEFKGYDYLVPKVAMKSGTIVQFEYGFGAFGRVQENGRVLEVSEDEHQALRKSIQENYYHVAVAVSTYMGTKDKDES